MDTRPEYPNPEHLAHVPSSQREPSHISSQGKEAASVTHDIYINGLSDVFFTFLQELAIFDSFFDSGFIDFHLFGVELIKSSHILAFNWVVLGFDPVPVLRWMSQYLLDLI